VEFIFRGQTEKMEINPNLSSNAKRDIKLVNLAREGDEKAFSMLLNRYKDAIYYMLLKMVNNRNDAEDLTIEAFGKAFTNLYQYSPQFAFSTWLFRIASNNGVDFLRKKKSKTVSFENNNGGSNRENGYGSMIKSDSLTPEESYIRKQRAVILRKIISKLKPRYRTLVELRYFKEYSYEEISKELNLPLGTVKVQLFRSREMLFNLLKNTGVGKSSKEEKNKK
jgi:RNA polymerase sigma-70 factor (ECF subfamily)